MSKEIEEYGEHYREMWTLVYKKNNKVLYSLSIKDLIKFCKDLEVEEIGLNKIFVPQIKEEDLSRMEMCDLNSPVILIKSPFSKNRLLYLDGSHRLRKAYLNKQKTIKAVVLRLEDKRIPEEWRILLKLKLREWAIKVAFIRFYDIDKTLWVCDESDN